ncbi:HNH endonuclease [Glaciihabitans tibetensis]|uniref:HNH endonuclease n=1 Tax=Glaciihabitans tibetensis TaxID=1266600 RepID=A0A2T0VBH6_9MICO|nr:DUF222 domain-containing protein [Glaciihabitans tibetensis]PRY67473.1 HNH endonuclease [Glaciihabitans tibetensis]
MAFRGFQPSHAAGAAAPDGARGSVAGLAPGDASLLFDPEGLQLPGTDGLEVTAAFAAAIEALRKIPTSVVDYDRLANDAIVGLLGQSAELHRLADACLAIVSGQLERRSAPELGSAGLARQQGHRTPIQMAKVVGRLPGQDAAKALRGGRLIHDTQIAATPTPDGASPIDPITGAVFAPAQGWLAPVGHALTHGLSLAAAESIQRGLGTPTEGVPEGALLSAARRLVVEAESLDPDLLLERARRARDELDLAGIGLREEERRQKRSLTFVQQKDGMSRLVWLMDPETAAGVGEVFDRVTSPRRGGPRHGAGTAVQHHADRILADARSTEQLASDEFAQLLRIGVDADSSALLGTGAPAVRILTTRPPRQMASQPAGAGDDADAGAGDDADAGADGRASADSGIERIAPAGSTFGPGWLEGQRDPVSPETVARLTCAGSTSEIPVDDSGQPLDVGREQRLFNQKQRIAISARDGGCRSGDVDGNGSCDRPPSWTEVHHVEQWKRDNGRTDIANGILMCKYHHLQLHNQGWEIHRDRATYWLVPPTSVDPKQTPRQMASRSEAMKQLVRFSATDVGAPLPPRHPPFG